MKKIKRLLAPSILSADFSRLEVEVKSAKQLGADWIHVDVMDGHFVPNLTMGPIVVSWLSKRTRLPLDCHLMVSEPERWIEPFAKAGAKNITIHVETSLEIERDLKRIRALGCRSGISLNPDTPVENIKPYLKYVDLVLVMSVFPGFGGQKFIEESYSRIQRIKELRGGLPFLIEVDGGVSEENAERLGECGVDVFVAGSALFSAKNRKKAFKDLKKAIA